MNQFKEQANYEMARAWLRTFYTSLKDVTYHRDSINGVLDPVTETYTGGDPVISVPVKGMFRKLKKSLQDGENITNSDVRFTILQTDLPTVTPTVNDKIIDSDLCEWRVLDTMEDTTDVFHNLILRRGG